MKYLKLFVLSILFVASTNHEAMAFTSNSNGPDLRKEIINMVDGIDLSEMGEDSKELRIQFVINAKKEIVVLDIEDSKITKQILKLIDKKIVKADGIEVNKLYIFPMVFNRK